MISSKFAALFVTLAGLAAAADGPYEMYFRGASTDGEGKVHWQVRQRIHLTQIHDLDTALALTTEPSHDVLDNWKLWVEGPQLEARLGSLSVMTAVLDLGRLDGRVRRHTMPIIFVDGKKQPHSAQADIPELGTKAKNRAGATDEAIEMKQIAPPVTLNGKVRFTSHDAVFGLLNSGQFQQGSERTLTFNEHPWPLGVFALCHAAAYKRDLLTTYHHMGRDAQLPEKCVPGTVVLEYVGPKKKGPPVNK